VCSASTTARIIFSDIAGSEHGEMQLQSVNPGECEALADECVESEKKEISR
jgi:hypothetical protein